MSGFIKLHRKIMSNPLFDKNPAARFVFVDLLLAAAWSDTVQDWRGTPVEVKRGEVMVSTRNLVKSTGFSHQRIRTLLSQLELHQNVKINTHIDRGPMLISICNYSKYQDQQHTANTPSNTQLTHSQHTKEEREELKKEEEEIDSAKALRCETEKDLLDEHIEKPKQPRKTNAVPKGQIEQAWTDYNQTAAVCGIPVASKLTAARRKGITARLKDYGLDGWSQALANIEKSSFLTGGTESGWKADLDFVCQAKSFDKLHDGGYGNGRDATPGSSISSDETDKLMQQIYGHKGIENVR